MTAAQTRVHTTRHIDYRYICTVLGSEADIEERSVYLLIAGCVLASISTILWGVLAISDSWAGSRGCVILRGDARYTSSLRT